MRKTSFLLSAITLVAIFVAACTSAPAPAPQVVKETVIVPQTVVVQAPAPTAAPAATAAAPVAAAGNRLKTVLDRKKLICGVNPGLAGFAALSPSGSYDGFDADFCRAMAAALFGDVKAVEFRPVDTTVRFAALQSGEVDIVFRNTTATIVRDTQNGVDFGPTTYYDGSGFMVPKKANAKKLEDLSGATICVLAGTTNAQVMADVFPTRNIKFTAQTFNDAPTLYQALDAGKCDAATSDASQLAGNRATLVKNPDDYIILDEVISKEPLTPMIAQNDSQWRDIMNWVVYATMYAEEQGITSKNVDTFKTSTVPDIKRLYGITDDIPKKMGLSNDAFYNEIKLVGNYGEIFERNLGASTKLKLARGLNNLWTKGGLIYAPPFH